jgi:hypothetical protein
MPEDSQPSYVPWLAQVAISPSGAAGNAGHPRSKAILAWTVKRPFAPARVRIMLVLCDVRTLTMFVAFVGADFLGVRVAHGSPAESAWALTWTAPDGCPSQDEVEQEALRLVGAGRQLAPMRIFADVAHIDAQHWKVEIRIATAEGSATRTMVGDSCVSLADATALFLALSLDAGRDPASAESTPQAVPRPISSAAAASKASEAPPTLLAVDRASLSQPVREDAAPRKRKNLWSSFSLGASASAEGDVLPSLAVGGEISFAWRPRPVRVEVAVADWGEQSISFTEVPSMGGTFRLVSGAVRGCYERPIGAFTIAPCAIAEIDHVQGFGYGDLTPKRGAADWIRAGMGALGIWRAARWVAVRALIGSTAALARPTFVIENVPIGYRPGVISGRASMGFELSIP